MPGKSWHPKSLGLGEKGVVAQICDRALAAFQASRCCRHDQQSVQPLDHIWVRLLVHRFRRVTRSTGLKHFDTIILRCRLRDAGAPSHQAGY